MENFPISFRVLFRIYFGILLLVFQVLTYKLFFLFQAYTSTLPGDCKETITWARFESADINDPAFFPDCTSDTVLPLILILGYNTGVQVLKFTIFTSNLPVI